MAARDVAVLCRPAGTSAELLEEVFAEAGIAFTLQRRRPFADAAVGRALIGLLRCVGAPEASERPGSLGDLLAYLRAPGVLERASLADSLELRARRRGAWTPSGRASCGRSATGAWRRSIA